MSAWTASSRTTSLLYRARAELSRGALELACHAAVPVALDSRFLHLLRVNFFLDPPDALPYEVEAELLNSALFHELGDGLYEVEAGLRDWLLSGLTAAYGPARLTKVAVLLEQYTDRADPWPLKELDYAQRLTALSIVHPERAASWLSTAAAATGEADPLAREWFVAMRSRLDQRPEDLESHVRAALASGDVREMGRLALLPGADVTAIVRALQRLGGDAAAEVLRDVTASVPPPRAAAREDRDPTISLLDLLGAGDAADFDLDLVRRLSRGIDADRHPRVHTPIGVGADRSVIYLDLDGSAGRHALIVGATGTGKSELLRTVVLGLAMQEPPNRVTFAFVDLMGSATFAPVDRLPHTVAIATGLADHRRGVVDFFEALEGELARRRAAEKSPALLVVIDDYTELLAFYPQALDTLVAIARAEPAAGMHLLLSGRRFDEGRLHDLTEHLSVRIGLRMNSYAESRAFLGIGAAAELPRAGLALMQTRRTRTPELVGIAYVSGPRHPVAEPDWTDVLNPPPPPETVLEWGVTTLALADRPAARFFPAAGEPRATSLLLLLGAGDLTPADLDRLRRRSALPRHSASDRLRVPIGVDAGENPTMLDLRSSSEGGTGPHGAIIGQAGSGKSDLLRTLILSLAITHSPDEVNFFFAGHRHGAIFADLDRLPHTAAVMTDIVDGPATVDDLAAALQAELLRRTELLRTSGNLDDLRTYENARGSRDDIEPLPILLVVFDEFPDLLTTRPELINIMVLIGRSGRSLGVHMLLVGQRLDAGRLRGLDTHLTYRIALRMSPEESAVLLGTTQAAELPAAPGHALLREDVGEPRRFRSASVAAAGEFRSGGWIVDRLEDKDQPVRRLTDARTPTTLGEVLGPTGNYGDRGFQVMNPGLHDTPSLPVAARPGDPEPIYLDITRSVLVSGPARSGKSVALTTLVCGLALTRRPTDAEIYLISMDGDSLSNLHRFPHVRAVAGRSDIVLLYRAFVHLEGSARGRATNPPAERGEVYLVVDGWPELESEFPELAQIASRRLFEEPALRLLASATPGAQGTIEMVHSQIVLSDGPAGPYPLLPTLALHEATPGEGEEEIARLSLARWTGARHQRPDRRVLSYRDLQPERDTGFRLPIGTNLLDDASVVAGIDFTAHPHLLVLGTHRCGKTALLQSLRTTIGSRFRAATAQLIDVEMRRIADLAETLRSRLPGRDVTAEQRRDRSWWQGPEFFVMADDYELLAGPANPLEPLTRFLPQASDLGLHLLIACRGGAEVHGDPIVALLRELQATELVMSAPADGPFLGAPWRTVLPPGFGRLITSPASVRMVKVAQVERPADV